MKQGEKGRGRERERERKVCWSMVPYSECHDEGCLYVLYQPKSQLGLGLDSPNMVFLWVGQASHRPVWHPSSPSSTKQWIKPTIQGSHNQSALLYPFCRISSQSYTQGAQAEAVFPNTLQQRPSGAPSQRRDWGLASRSHQSQTGQSQTRQSQATPDYILKGTASPDIGFHVSFFKIKSVVLTADDFKIFNFVVPEIFKNIFENCCCKKLTNLY